MPHERPSLRREAAIKMNIKGIVQDGFGLINLAYCRGNVGVLCM